MVASVIGHGNYWSLAECFLILLNIPVLKIAVVPSPSLPTPQSREELWGTHRNVSPPLPPLYVSRSTHEKCPQKCRVLPRLRPFTPSALCPSCDVLLWSAAGERRGCCCGLKDGVLLWPGHCRTPGAAASSIFFIFFLQVESGRVQFPLKGTWSRRILLGKMSPSTTGWRGDGRAQSL